MHRSAGSAPTLRSARASRGLHSSACVAPAHPPDRPAPVPSLAHPLRAASTARLTRLLLSSDLRGVGGGLFLNWRRPGVVPGASPKPATLMSAGGAPSTALVITASVTAALVTAALGEALRRFWAAPPPREAPSAEELVALVLAAQEAAAGRADRAAAPAARRALDLGADAGSRGAYSPHGSFRMESSPRGGISRDESRGMQRSASVGVTLALTLTLALTPTLAPTLTLTLTLQAFAYADADADADADA